MKCTKPCNVGVLLGGHSTFVDNKHNIQTQHLLTKQVSSLKAPLNMSELEDCNVFR
jgi:hypothetical protein